MNKLLSYTLTTFIAVIIFSIPHLNIFLQLGLVLLFMFTIHKNSELLSDWLKNKALLRILSSILFFLFAFIIFLIFYLDRQLNITRMGLPNSTIDEWNILNERSTQIIRGISLLSFLEATVVIILIVFFTKLYILSKKATFQK